MSACTKTSCAAARLALVTGGGSGIGKSVCHALASEGVHVIVADLNLDAATAAASSLPGSQQHLAFKVDAGRSASVNLLFQDIQKTCVRSPNIVVNCAGIALPATAAVDTTEEDFDKIIRVNLKVVTISNYGPRHYVVRSDVKKTDSGHSGRTAAPACRVPTVMV
ncbi:hypothetical protein HPB47_003875 [Ixodes persulcatus]|uniref:Uncharacterized protein n=1 Tax=Ixodes persulcatus TaxID=34615 RepID=A0AC60PIC4_IXOPE|nr:hypothetical protein HPB47_003875 [Ixodes persulcatus]